MFPYIGYQCQWVQYRAHALKLHTGTVELDKSDECSLRSHKQLTITVKIYEMFLNGFSTNYRFSGA